MREIMLAEFRRRDFLADAARNRLASQAAPDESTASEWSDIPSLVRVGHACGRTLATLLATVSRPSGLRGEAPEQTALTAAI